MVLVKPFAKKKTYYFEVYNEITLLTCSYFLMVFCDILMDYEIRYAVGWYMVCVTLLNVLANWTNLVASVLKKLCKQFKKWMLKRRKT
jgi:hypothetical protein